jgi:Ca2+/H+ antiporter, TMEM165/GDT1 family
LEVLINSFLLVFVGEMGDKTQLLALVLTSRFQRPWAILLGIFIATSINHALASWAGGWVGSLVTPETLRWVLAVVFFTFAVWVLVPDREGELKSSRQAGAFVTTLIAFFLAEMGDKTQLATVALGARYSNLWLVTFGTTFGLMAANVPVVFLGNQVLSKIPMQYIRIFACILFLLFAIGILIAK